jgi:putative transposase
MVSVD